MTIRCNRSPDLTLRRFSDRLSTIKDETARDNFAVTCLHDLHLFDACKPVPQKTVDKLPDIFAEKKSQAETGRYIRVKDSKDKWYPAKILAQLSAGEDQVKIHYHGWDSKYDEVVSLQSNRVGFYTSVKDLLKDQRWFEKYPLKDVDLSPLFKSADQKADPHRKLYEKLLTDYPNPGQNLIFWDDWDGTLED